MNNYNGYLWALLEICFWLSSHVLTTKSNNWSPTIYNNMEICGKTIGTNDTGGILTFNSLLLPVQHRLECRVEIQPKPVGSFSTTGNYVLFHFSDLDVGGQCIDTSITVLDGNGINMAPIKGLENPLCDRISGLTNYDTFTTQSFFITVIFQRNYSGLNFRTKFNLTFLSFSEGHCGSGREDLFSCNNSRCIDKKFTCQNWNACGDNSDCPTNIDYEEIVKYFIYGAVAVVGIGVLYFLYKCAKCTKKCIDKCFDCCTDCVDDCDCSCCTDLVGGILDGCRSLKSTVTSRIGFGGSRHDSNRAAMEQTVQFTDNIDRGDNWYRRRGLDPPAPPYAPPRDGRNLVRTASDQVLNDRNNEIENYDTPPRAHGARAYNDGDGDGLSMPESIDLSDDDMIYDLNYHRRRGSDRHSDRNNPTRHNNIDHGTPMGAPPSYHEATASAPPLEAAFHTPPDSPALPTYDEFLANQTKYGSKS